MAVTARRQHSITLKSKTLPVDCWVLVLFHTEWWRCPRQGFMASLSSSVTVFHKQWAWLTKQIWVLKSFEDVWLDF